MSTEYDYMDNPDKAEAQRAAMEPLLAARPRAPAAYETPRLGQFKKEKNVPNNRSIFKLTAEDLELFFNKEHTKLPDNEGECRIGLNLLKACGYNAGLCSHLCTDRSKGIIGDAADLRRRKEVFGVHSIAMPEIQPFTTILYCQFEDVNVRLLTWAATIYLFFSFFSKDETHNGAIESLTIYFGLMFACALAALCDWIKERQHLQLKDEINNQTVTVFRGAYGTAHSVPVRELVVGDVVQLSQGDRIPADCIVLEEINLAVDQSGYGSKGLVKKDESSVKFDARGEQEDNHKTNPDNVLLSDSKVMRGEARALVCAVGRHTLLARSRKKEHLLIDEEHTDLEKKLEKVSDSVSARAQLAMGACFATQLIYCLFFVLISSDEEKQLLSSYTLLRIVRIAIVAICILIVAIPEGLPLAVSVAMALSITRMKKDKILIKNIGAVQRCAILHDICVSKTGTLTEGEMHVASFQLVSQNQVHDNDIIKGPTAFNEDLEINVDLKDLIKEAITMNTDARIEIGEDEDGTYKYLAKGQATEVGMIDFLLENGEDVQSLFVRRNVNCVKLIQFPFDQKLKRKTVVRNNATNSETVRIYVKGAPEAVIPLCNATVDDGIRRVDFLPDDQERVLGLVAEQIAGKGHKPLSYAFKEVDKAHLQDLMEAAGDKDEDEGYRKEFESNLFYLGTFGLEDPLRSEIHTPINLIKYGHTDDTAETSTQVNVRMISGDHLETCKSVAVKAGIVTPNELKMEGTAMTGAQFRAAIGLTKNYDGAEAGAKQVAKTEQFKSVKKRVKIIARATPEDKLLLIRGIQQLGGLIAMAGDSIADSEVLKQADVGLCMGTGCDVAKDNSDLVITDNNFGSIRRSILWGRAMFENVMKFLQFQLTINFSVVSIVFISGCTLGSVPFNVIQLLWINLIMDVLAAIALGTEPIAEKTNVSVTNKEARISRAAKIFTPAMWRNIVVQAVYQIVIVLCLLYFGTFLFVEEYNLVTATLREHGKPTPKMQMNTMIFYAYFLMNMANQINCRVVDEAEFLMFRPQTLCSNFIFWAVFAAEMAVTHLMLLLGKTHFGTAVLGLTTMTWLQYGVCWFCGLLSFALFIVAKTAIPMKPFESLMLKVDLE